MARRWAVAALALAMGAPGRGEAQSCDAPAFKDAASLGPARAGHVLAGDFDRDGRPDVLATSSERQLLFFRGLGNGTFASALVSVIDEPAGPIVSGDFNRDGILDLVVVLDRGGSGDVLGFMRGNGDGTFAPLAAITAGGDFVALLAGSFRDPSHLDLLLSDGSGGVYFLGGNGDGTFTGRNEIAVGAGFGALAAGDFNRDGRLDFLVAVDREVHRYFGAGDGTFTLDPASPVTGTSAPAPGMVVADLNRDGWPDAAVLDPGASLVQILLNDRAGGFARSTFAEFGRGSSIAIGDFDTNGIPDLAVGQESGSRFVLVGLGDGTGKFPRVAPITVDDTPTSLAVADFQGDGRPDFAAGTAADPVSIRLNDFGFGCPASSFGRTARMVRTTSLPLYVARGDFDGDGITDLALTTGTGSLLAFQGTGLGYVLRATIPVATQLTGVVALDFDLDTRADVAVADYDGNRLVVLRGDGSFGFTPTATTGTGSQPGAIVAADFNRDGRPDLATADYASNAVTVAFGNGSAGFAGTTSLPGLPGPASLAAADFDLDGNPDLAVANLSGGTVSLFRGDGAGNFAPPTSLPGLGTPRWVAVTDLDRNGRPDLVVADQAGDRVVRFLGNGDGTFAAGVATPVGDQPLFVADGDFTGEGAPDIAVVNFMASSVTVLLGDGSGNLAAGPTFPTGASPYSLAVVDFNLDGHEDLAVPNTGSDNISLLAGNGDGTFDATTFFDSSTTGFFLRSAVGDVDRDGRLDLLVTDRAAGQLRFYKGDGAGGFAPPALSPGFASDSGGFAVADFTGDGVLDVLVGESGGVRFGLGLAGTFSPGSVFDTSGAPASIAVADFDRDGRLDLAAANGVLVTIGLGNGAGTFAALGSVPVGSAGDSASTVVVTDFDRDGIADLVVAVNGNAGRLVLLQGRGDGTFALPGEAWPIANSASSVAVADFNGDGIQDLAATNGQAGLATVSIFLGRGGPPTGPPYFQAAGSVTTGLRPVWVIAADLNGDGQADLATANIQGASLSVARGKGNGEFEPAEDWEVPGNPRVLAAGDLDRDGKPDLVSLQFDGTRHSASVFLNTNCDDRRLHHRREPPACNVEDVAFGTQPQLDLRDDGANLLQCAAGSVAASRLPGTGNPAGSVVGLNPTAFAAGVATFTNLAMDLPGRRYRLHYAHDRSAATARSRPFNVGASLAAIGPTQVCAGSSATWDAGPGWDTVQWTLDTVPVGTGQTLTRALAAGLHTLRVDTTLDSCSAFTEIGVTSSPTLTGATISASGSTVVCPACVGGTATVSTAGGGTSTYQWGWRPTPGGTFNPIAGATSATYVINAANFNSGTPGAYYLVARVTPQCGLPSDSNEVKVILFTVSPGNEVPFVTATSRSGESVVEWVNPPAPYEDTLVRFTSVPGTATCAAPANPGAGTQLALVAGTAGAKGSAPHTGLANDNTTYCYSVFVHKGGGVFSTGRPITGHPFDTTGRAKWAFNTGAFAMVTPGNGVGQIHVTTMADALHSAVEGPGGGLWPAAWTPRPLTDPAQGRPNTVSPSSPVGGASRVIFLGTEGGIVNAINADTGGVAWSHPLPNPVPAPVTATASGYFTFFAGSEDFVLVGTRNGGVGVPNAFYALRLADGTEAWSYDGSANALRIGVIAGQASVDYDGRRVYFASAAFGAGAGERDTVWCLDVVTGARLWSVELPDVTVSPIVRGGRVYVASYDGVRGRIHALDAATGASVWGGASYDVGPGEAVKSFVAADRTSSRLLFSTTNKVWALDDPGTAPPSAWVWQRDALSESDPIPSPSTPAYLAGGPHLWVGSSDGRLFRLDYATGATQIVVPLGDAGTPSPVGSPTLDIREGFLYVGTAAGVVYAVQIP